MVALDAAASACSAATSAAACSAATSVAACSAATLAAACSAATLAAACSAATLAAACSAAAAAVCSATIAVSASLFFCSLLSLACFNCLTSSFNRATSARNASSVPGNVAGPEDPNAAATVAATVSGASGTVPTGGFISDSTSITAVAAISAILAPSSSACFCAASLASSSAAASLTASTAAASSVFAVSFATLFRLAFVLDGTCNSFKYFSINSRIMRRRGLHAPFRPSVVLSLHSPS